jgi:hypothetical protein
VGEPVPPRHRRRERRRTQPAPPVDDAPREHAAPPAAPPAEVSAPPPAEVSAPPAGQDEPPGSGPGDAPDATGAAAKRKTKTRRNDVERGLRGIVGAGPSQVGVLGAMRARDAARPTAEDLAAAERDVVIVRRHYVPPDNLPGAR